MQILRTLYIYLASIFVSLWPFTPSYTEGVLGQPVSFLPSEAKSKNDQTISSLIYRGLFKYDIYGSLIPDLAEKYEISEDGLTYTIKLKDNQFWSNGKKITADDLIYTSFKVANLSGVGTDKVDDLTIRFILPNKYSPFLHLLTVGVMPANSVEAGKPLKSVSSGPFRIMRIERDGAIVREVVLVNQNGDTPIKRISFKYYASEEDLDMAARLGEIDGFITSTTHEISDFEEYRYPIQSVYYALYFNLRNEKFQDAEFRKTLAKVLSQKDIVEGFGIPVQGPISRNQSTDKSLNFDYYDKDFSQDLSDKIVTITYPDLRPHEDMAEIIRDKWRQELGIEVVLNDVDPEKIVKDVIEPRNFEILLYGQAIGRDPDRYINWHSTQKDSPGLNISGFEHVRADRALEEGRNELNEEKRFIHYQGFQKVVNEQVPVIFLYHPYARHYVSKYITGIGKKYTFTEGDRFLDFPNWKRIKTN